MDAVVIRPARWGLAYRYGNVVEINPVLKNYPRLYEETLKHELEHDPESQMDFWHDLKSLIKGFSFESFKFTVQHPIISLQSAMPVWYDEEWHHNNFAILIWSASALMVAGTLTIL